MAIMQTKIYLAFFFFNTSKLKIKSFDNWQCTFSCFFYVLPFRYQHLPLKTPYWSATIKNDSDEKAQKCLERDVFSWLRKLNGSLILILRGTNYGSNASLIEPQNFLPFISTSDLN